MAESIGKVQGRSTIIIAILLSIIGILIALGPWTIFPVCDSGASTMICHYTAEAEIIIGSLVVLAAVPLVFLKRAESIIVIGLMEAALGVWTILVPTALLGLCKPSFMECQTIGGPALTLWGIITILLSIYLIMKGWRRKG
ncbi:MAG: hypothetical protein A4E32_01974 [Methanomassiliicoccales archaeon PtaU1.Bin124]|nr:MAG: hypothetical protein A4E32_01974 [Methanomassiliicoccales archaeon PtaU1.Bin124]